MRNLRLCYSLTGQECMAPNGGRHWWSRETVAVVTGANKGIGYEIVRQLAMNDVTVVLTARDIAKGDAAIHALKSSGLEWVLFHQLDITRLDSISEFAFWLRHMFGGIDILINNAGIVPEHTSPYDAVVANAVVDTNYFGTKTVIQQLLPLLRASPDGARIVNVTSRIGSYERLAGEHLREKFLKAESYTEEFVDSIVSKYLEDVKLGRAFDQGWIPLQKAPIYSESKIFLSAYSLALARKLADSQSEDHRIIVTAFCPGVTDTDSLCMLRKKGSYTPDVERVKSVLEGADTGVWLALLPLAELLGKNGKVFAERREYAYEWNAPC